MKNIQRVAWFLLFLASGLLVFIIFSHYYPVYKGSTGVAGRIIVAVIFLALALLARSNEHLQKYWLIPFAYFVALIAISLDYYFDPGQWLYPTLGIVEMSPVGLAVDKFQSSLIGIVTVLVINRLASQRTGSLYIRRGRLWLGLTVGLVAFVVMIVTVIPVTEANFQGQNLTWARVLSWSPWVLIFVLANASNEELLFRGLFIGKMEPFLGKFATNIATTIPFVLAHFLYRLCNRPDGFPCAASPAGFAGMVLADAKNK